MLKIALFWLLSPVIFAMYPRPIFHGIALSFFNDSTVLPFISRGFLEFLAYFSLPVSRGNRVANQSYVWPKLWLWNNISINQYEIGKNRTLTMHFLKAYKSSKKTSLRLLGQEILVFDGFSWISIPTGDFCICWMQQCVLCVLKNAPFGSDSEISFFFFDVRLKSLVHL